MGTRADFYIGRGETAEWLGSIAWDGYPSAVREDLSKVLHEDDWRKAVAHFFERRDDVTLPADGWPWPWDTSHTTDYAYAFDDGMVYVSNYGHEWWPLMTQAPEREPGAEKVAVFPNMRERMNVALGKRSGLIVIGVDGKAE